jgi:drug/metabolite transporter (DMT)-like permease
MTPFRENLRGIVAISACNLLFLINDTMIKLANAALPLGEILLIRGIFAALFLMPIVVLSGASQELRLLWHPSVGWRIAAEIFSAVFFLTALFHIPIANVNAIVQVVPLMVTASAAIFLGEEVGWKRWLAIAVGFAGVLIVIRPGFEGFNAFSLVAIAAAAAISLRDMTTRMMPRRLPALLVALATAVSVCLTGPVLGIAFAEEWVVPSGSGFALMAGAAAFLIGGYLTAVDFMRHGDIAAIAPFRYSAVVWAIIVGLIVWGEVPDLLMIVGTVIIVATGIYTFHRERRLARIIAERDVDL